MKKVSAKNDYGGGGLDSRLGEHIIRMWQALDRFFGQFLRYLSMDEGFIQGCGTHGASIYLKTDMVRNCYQAVFVGDQMLFGRRVSQRLQAGAIRCYEPMAVESQVGFAMPFYHVTRQRMFASFPQFASGLHAAICCRMTPALIRPTIAWLTFSRALMPLTSNLATPSPG